MSELFERGKKPEDIVVDMVTSKFDDINRNIEKIFRWQQKADSKINEVENAFNELKSSFKTVEYQIISKASAYQDTINDFKSSMEAFDRLLAKLSPMIAKNVNDLEISTQRIKEIEAERML